MAQSSTDINLISTKTDLPPEFVAIAGHLRRVGVSAIVVSLAFAIFFGVGVSVLHLRVSALANEKTTLLTRMNSSRGKGGVAAIVKKQSGVAQKVITSIKPWQAVLAQIATIAPATLFTSLSVNEKGEVSLLVSSPTVLDAAGVVFRISGFIKDNSIGHPFLDSLEMGVDGNVKMAITFVPTLIVK